MKIHLATITHRFGNNAYAALTEDDLISNVATYCRQNWSDSARSDEPVETFTDDTIIDAYFDGNDEEGVTFADVMLVLPAGVEAVVPVLRDTLGALRAALGENGGQALPQPLRDGLAQIVTQAGQAEFLPDSASNSRAPARRPRF